MGKIIKINLYTTDGNWQELCDELYAIDEVYTIKDETIVNKVLAETSVRVIKWYHASNAYDFTGNNPMYINTSNIVGIEVVREESEE